MIVVSDATPISTLLKVDQATLLKKLFDTVIIPEAVSKELMAFHPQIPGFVRVQSVTARHRRLPGTEKLGKGEAEAILLAKEVGADILLTDDRKARAAAVSLNVRCTGLLGLQYWPSRPIILNPLRQWSKSSRSRAGFTCRPTSRSKP
jgi:uncharacterized protein